ncbi:hypothetical protein LSAT2_005304 [Lamellibrachia satsuma]|nr:hypothetical protein LSAT2_005304 [Lamellibrachia satsuma]
MNACMRVSAGKLRIAILSGCLCQTDDKYETSPVCVFYSKAVRCSLPCDADAGVGGARRSERGRLIDRSIIARQSCSVQSVLFEQFGTIFVVQGIMPQLDFLAQTVKECFCQLVFGAVSVCASSVRVFFTSDVYVCGHVDRDSNYSVQLGDWWIHLESRDRDPLVTPSAVERHFADAVHGEDIGSCHCDYIYCETLHGLVCRTNDDEATTSTERSPIFVTRSGDVTERSSPIKTNPLPAASPTHDNTEDTTDSDRRISACALGSIALIVMATELAFLIVLDWPTFGRQFKFMRRNLRHAFAKERGSRAVEIEMG